MVMVIFSHDIFLRVKICMVLFFFPRDSQGLLDYHFGNRSLTGSNLDSWVGS